MAFPNIAASRDDTSPVGEKHINYMTLEKKAFLLSFFPLIKLLFFPMMSFSNAFALRWMMSTDASKQSMPHFEVLTKAASIEPFAPIKDISTNMILGEKYQSVMCEQFPDWDFSSEQFSAFLMLPDTSAHELCRHHSEELEEVLNNLAALTQYCEYLLFVPDSSLSSLCLPLFT